MERLSALLVRPLLLIGAIVGSVLVSSTATAQVRTKKPDRGVYQSPVVGESQSKSGSRESTKLTVADEEPQFRDSLASLKPAPKPKSQSVAKTSAKPKPAKWGAPLEDTELVDIHANVPAREASSKLAVAPLSTSKVASTSDLKVRPTSHSELQPAAANFATASDSRSPLRDPGSPQANPMPIHQPVSGQEIWLEPPVTHAHESGEVIYQDDGVSHPLFAAPSDGSFDCDALYDGGCDSMNGGCGLFGFGPNSTIVFSPERWFWSAELLMMHRSGTRIPALVTSTSDAAPIEDTAGELGQAGTTILDGNASILKDVTAGGRFTIGTWLDNCQDRSLVFRGWFAGEETHDFSTDQSVNPVIARPFNNVSDGQAAEQDTQLIAFPAVFSGSVSVRAESNVYGADLSIRQEWWNDMGLNVDLLYGYQHMRVDESLSISSASTSLTDSPPLNSVLAINDSFAAKNEFHGGQLGIASLYREGCWSFRSLAKVGFGSLRREATLSGSTVTSIDGASSTSNQGLLVRDTNSGRVIDNTFGWVPELDFTLGWHRYPRFDTTIGYHIAAMTDALQPGGMIDSTLSSNLSNPATGSQSPARTFRYNTFYVQGIHFGIAYIY